MRILHTFNDYLPESMNWAGNIIANTPDSTLFVAASRFLKTNFFFPNVTYVEFPLREGGCANESRFGAIFDRGVRAARSTMYPRYLRARIGRVDIVHSHFATAGWNFRHFAAVLGGARHIVSFYGYDYEKVPRSSPVWRQRYRMLFDQADLLLCEGAHGASLLAQLGAPEQKVGISPLGILPQRIVQAPRLKQPQQLRLLQVATLTEKKGHIYTLRAFINAYRECPNIQLSFVGWTRDAEGEEILQSLRREAEEAGVCDRVTFLPPVPYESLYNLFAAFDVFIHPSTYSASRDCEGGAPIVLLDAQATGMPVIATKHCDIPSEVLHGETGLLAEERDVDTLAAYIRQFYAMDQTEYDRFAGAARRHVESSFDVEKNARQLKAMYEELLSSRL